jgi:hypothetical protein
MRSTPWWSLMKVALILLAEIYDLYIFSRPPCDLDGDPHFKKLREVSTIVEFCQSAGDREVAQYIEEQQMDVLVDAGGPTTNSFVGVMALRPAKVQMAHLGFPGDQSGGHIDWSLVDQFVVDPDGIQGVGGHCPGSRAIRIHAVLSAKRFLSLRVCSNARPSGAQLCSIRLGSD